jgi:hypothetical protein
MYQVIKQFKERNWEVGDIVKADDFSAEKLLQEGYVEEYTGDEPPKHTVINVDPVKLSAKQ